MFLDIKTFQYQQIQEKTNTAAYKIKYYKYSMFQQYINNKRLSQS